MHIYRVPKKLKNVSPENTRNMSKPRGSMKHIQWPCVNHHFFSTLQNKHGKSEMHLKNYLLRKKNQTPFKNHGCMPAQKGPNPNINPSEQIQVPLSPKKNSSNTQYLDLIKI